MKTLEKLENFKLGNVKLEKIVGGNQNTTGGGSYVEYNWPRQGVNTCVTYTSDVWDGSNPRTMLRLGCSYDLEP